MGYNPRGHKGLDMTEVSEWVTHAGIFQACDMHVVVGRPGLHR